MEVLLYTPTLTFQKSFVISYHFGAVKIDFMLLIIFKEYLFDEMPQLAKKLLQKN